MADSLADRLDGFPAEARHLFTSLVGLDLQSAEVLTDQVDRHLADLEAGQDDSEFLDLTTARSLAREAHRLLTHYAGAPEDDQRLIQAAVLYFVMDRDASPDSLSFLGLEDDQGVLRSVARHLEDRDHS